MAAASTFMLAQGVLGSIASVASGMAQADALRNQADSMVANAALQKSLGERNAYIAMKSGKSQKEEVARSDKRQIARTIANQGASGVDTGAGTPLDMQADQILESGFRQGKVMAAASAKAEGFITQGNLNSYSSLLQSQSLLASANRAEMGGWLGGGTTLLGSLAQGAQLGGGFFG